MIGEKRETEFYGESMYITFVYAENVTMKEDGKVYTAKRDPSTSVDYGDIKSYWGVNHSKQIDDFYDCLETDKEMFVDLDGAFETLKMVMAIYESGKTGKKVNLK